MTDKIMVVALKHHYYEGKPRDPGDTYEAKPIHARMLGRQRKVEPAPPPAPPQAEVEPAPPPQISPPQAEVEPRPVRRGRRRDMTSVEEE